MPVYTVLHGYTYNNKAGRIELYQNYTSNHNTYDIRVQSFYSLSTLLDTVYGNGDCDLGTNGYYHFASSPVGNGELHAYDFSSNSWSLIRSDLPEKSRRSYQARTIAETVHSLQHPGVGDILQFINYHPKSNTLTMSGEIYPVGNETRAPLSSCVTTLDSKFCIFGGSSGQSTYTNWKTLFTYNPKTLNFTTNTIPESYVYWSPGGEGCASSKDQKAYIHCSNDRDVTLSYSYNSQTTAFSQLNTNAYTGSGTREIRGYNVTAS